uniref:Phosphatidylinositol-4,5-bisphosphate 4-phosphatase n=1 Tax=Onchocerca volvulus TaxID=6282 RepID=A0A8R1TMF2_ONCVO
MISDEIITITNNSINDNSNQNTGNIRTVHHEIQINQHSSIKITTMMKKTVNQTKNDDDDSENEAMEEINRECLLEVFPTNLIKGPPPAYSLTSPCLPPNSLEEQDWPPESPSYFDGYPPYPAGTPLLKVAYPKDIPGPTYACPKCNGRFLYYRPAGIVRCPFCHTAISIGHYIRIRTYSHIIFGLLFLIVSLTFGLGTRIFANCSTSYSIAC